MPSVSKAPRTVKWMDYARRSMQRLGFVKLVLNAASPSQTQTLESVTRAFHRTVTDLQSLDGNNRARFTRYVTQQQLYRRYPSNRESVELQDYYLSDPTLPSHTGAITGDLVRAGYRHAVYVEIPAWAVRLQLLRPQNYTLTDRGRVLLLAGRQPPISDSEPSKTNPFRLSLPERYLALYSMLDVDGDLLHGMYKRLLETSTFTRAHAGVAAVDALEELRRTQLKHPPTGKMQQTRLKLDRVVASAQNQKPGGMGPRESIATPRTEPLVDCGILIKPHPDKYEYAFTPWGKSFLIELVSSTSINDFLEQRLSMAFSPLTTQHVGTHATLDSVNQAYDSLRVGIGYVSLRELAVWSVAIALQHKSLQLFEIQTIEDAITSAASLGRRYVRLAHGRIGGIAQVRINPSSPWCNRGFLRFQ